LELVDAAKVARTAKQQQERAERDRENRRYELRQKREKEKKRVDDLINEATAWKKAQLIREYLVAVRGEPRQEGDAEPDGKLDAWLKWAADQADRLDPITPSPPSVLDADAELDHGW
jgi:hypothetical protein